MSNSNKELMIRKKILLLILFTMIPVALAWVFLAFMGANLIFIPLLLLIVSPILAFFLAAKTVQAITGLFSFSFRELDEAIRGDLTVRLTCDSNDESAEIKKRLNDLLENQVKTIRQFAGSSQLLARTAFVLNDKSIEMSHEVGDAATQVSMVASASEEMAATFTQIAGNCASAVQSAQEANSAAQQGEATINDTVSAMNRVSEIVRDSAAIMETLGTRSQQIGAIISLINDIADQTNLLALNATIEAARAGEHGKGFAVVAEEVKELAKKTTSATRDIDNSIKAMQTDAKNAVNSAENGVKEVEQGVKEAMKSGIAFKNVLDQISVASEQISQIAEASNQQTAVVGEITSNIHNISMVIENAAKNLDENSRTASGLAELFAELNMTIGKYRLSTLNDVETLAKEAAAYVKQAGRERGIEELCNSRGRFMKDGLYVTGHGVDGSYLANPANPHLMKSTGTKSKEKLAFEKRCIEVAAGGGGWVEYEVVNPATKRIQRKKARIENVPGAGMYVMCGVFIDSAVKHAGNSRIGQDPVLVN